MVVTDHNDLLAQSRYNILADHPRQRGFARPLGIAGIKSLKTLNCKMILATYHFYAIFFILLTSTFKYENIVSVNCCIQFEIVSDQMNQE